MDVAINDDIKFLTSLQMQLKYKKVRELPVEYLIYWFKEFRKKNGSEFLKICVFRGEIKKW